MKKERVDKMNDTVDEQNRRGFFAYLNRHPILESALIALVLNFVMEIVSRRSLISAVSFLVHSPHFFLAGWAVIFLTLSLAPLFPKKIFIYCLFGILWLSMAITNAVLVVIRTAPFEAVDFSIIRTGLGIITIYMKVWQIILIALAILGALAGIVVLSIKTKSRKVMLKRALIGIVISALISFGLIVPLNLLGYYPYAFSNLTESYDRYGFTYCFTCSIFDRGVNKPDGYSREAVDELTARIDAETPVKAESNPNVIILQLESFFDVGRLADVTFSENPIPYFTELKETCSSGLLTVPTIGAGTANTEFELVTGMSHHDFGTGEYPYKSFLQRESCESIAYVLGELGYGSHAIHNYSATFYARNVAYASLGFDTFTPIEYMNGLEYN
ncbi:MAG: sulfatase-like hydrolase/transferase, partial [Clostridia bacterium]|nr:sulfatase-like hydrolase/transferase [Clostridia bacterium]